VKTIMAKTDGIVDIDWYVEDPQPRARFVDRPSQGPRSTASASKPSRAICNSPPRAAPSTSCTCPASARTYRSSSNCRHRTRTQPDVAARARNCGATADPSAPLVPLSELVRIERSAAGPNLYRKNLNR
jgi:hypothetical protein